MLSDATLKKKYGITQADYESLLRKQNGVCAICKCHQRYQSLAVDHCHKTKQVRGLLCVQCNRGLGRFFDSPVRLKNAAEYILHSRQTAGGTSETPSIRETPSVSQVPPFSPSSTGKGIVIPEGSTCETQTRN
jgi:recombination endonuclease VII